MSNEEDADSPLGSHLPPGITLTRSLSRSALQRFQEWDQDTEEHHELDELPVPSSSSPADDLEEVPGLLEVDDNGAKVAPSESELITYSSVQTNLVKDDVSASSVDDTSKRISPKDRRFSASRRYSFNTVRRLSANIQKIFSPNRRSSKTETDGKGKVFWLHHGECVNDEKNALTGVIDTTLTEFGRHQAITAGQGLGRKLAKDGTQINVVYCSYMTRALDTLQHVIVRALLFDFSFHVYNSHTRRRRESTSRPSPAS